MLHGESDQVGVRFSGMPPGRRWFLSMIKGVSIGDTLARVLLGIEVLEKVSVLATPFVCWNRLEHAGLNNYYTVT
jgi:hypothetical protein